MAIKKTFIAALSALSIFVSDNIVSQTLDEKKVSLKSLEHKSVVVSIELDHVNDRITLALNPLTLLCISGYRDLIEDVKVIDEKFIALHYKVRGGSGFKMERSVLICISKDKLYKAMDIVSMQNYELKNTYDKEVDSLGLYEESGMYKVKFINIKNDKQIGYELIATQYENIVSKSDVSKNSKTIDTLRFSFDDKNKVFYTQYESLKGNYVFEGTSSKQKVFKGDKYPLIKLKKSL